MSNLPDDFNQSAFDRRWGGEVPRHLKDDLQAVVNATDALTESIRAVRDIAYRFGFPLSADDLDGVFEALDELLHDRIDSELRALDEEGLAEGFDFSTLQCYYRMEGLPQSAYHEHIAARRAAASALRPIMQNPQTHADRGQPIQLEQFGIGEWKMRNGRKAVVDRIHEGSKYPLAGPRVHDFGIHDTEWWRANGRWSVDGLPNDYDLIGPWEKSA